MDSKIIWIIDSLTIDERQDLSALLGCRKHGQSLALSDIAGTGEENIPRWTEVPKDEPPFSRQVVLGYLDIWNRDKHKIGR